MVYLLENLNFLPDEHGYVEQFVDPDEVLAAQKAEEEKKAPNEDESKQLKQQVHTQLVQISQGYIMQGE